MHLFIPLLASFIFVVSLVCVKRVANPRPGKTGLGPVTVLFFSNQAMALAFTFFWRKSYAKSVRMGQRTLMGQTQSCRSQINIPAMAALISVARKPPSKAFEPKLARSERRLGAMAPIPPN